MIENCSGSRRAACFDCESRAWAKVSFELATDPDAFDVMKFEASYIRKGEAPFRMKPSEVKRAASGPYGTEHEATLLAQQGHRELGAVESPVIIIHIAKADLPEGGIDCAPVADVFEGAGELCARRIDTTDERLVASTRSCITSKAFSVGGSRAHIARGSRQGSSPGAEATRTRGSSPGVPGISSQKLCIGSVGGERSPRDRAVPSAGCATQPHDCNK